MLFFEIESPSQYLQMQIRNNNLIYYSSSLEVCMHLHIFVISVYTRKSEKYPAYSQIVMRENMLSDA